MVPRSAALVSAAMLIAATGVAASGDPLFAPAPQGEITEAGTASLHLGQDIVGRPTVEVRLGTVGPYPFILDTGAVRSIVSKELAAELGLAITGSMVLHDLGGPSRVDTVVIPSMSFGSDTARNITAPALPRRLVGAAGIIGIDALQSRTVVLDLRANSLTISSAARPKTEPDDRETVVVRARNRSGQLILTNAWIDGKRIDVVIDSGAEGSVGNLALRRHVLRRGGASRLKQTRLIGLTGSSIPAEYTFVPNVEIGGLKIENMAVAFADAHPFRKLGLHRRPALLLGMETLRAFDQIAVDFPNRRVHFLLPDKAATAPTGLKLAGEP